MPAAKVMLALTRYQYNLKTIESATLTNSVQSLQEFDAKELGTINFFSDLVIFSLVHNETMKFVRDATKYTG